jgi:hypothetical protein
MTMNDRDHRIYRSFEEFEREELRRMEGVSVSVGDMIGDLFAEELDFEARKSRRSSWNDDDEE